MTLCLTQLTVVHQADALPCMPIADAIHACHALQNPTWNRTLSRICTFLLVAFFRKSLPGFPAKIRKTDVGFLHWETLRLKDSLVSQVL